MFGLSFRKIVWNARCATPGPMLQERVWNPGIRCSSSACSNFKLWAFYHLILVFKNPFFLLELNFIPQSTHFLLSRSFVLVRPAVRRVIFSLLHPARYMVSTKDLALALVASCTSKDKKHGARKNRPRRKDRPRLWRLQWPPKCIENPEPSSSVQLAHAA